MLITEEFFKDIKNLSAKKRQKIISKLKIFENEIKENVGVIRGGSAGFWIIGLRNGVYKFRLNIKDRILFVFKKNRETGKRDIVQFLRYINHDKQILVGEKIEIDKDFINYNTGLIEERDEYFLEKYNFEEIILDDIPAIVLEDSDLNDYFFEDTSDFLYYMSDEQYNILSQKNNKSIILKGAGGTGKTIVLLNKLLGIKKFYKDIEKRIGYITYTELLVENVQRMYSIFAKKEKVYGAVDFIFIRKLYGKYFTDLKENLVTNSEAIQWIELNKHAYKVLKKSNGYDIFSEIRGIIKGYLGINGQNIVSLYNGKTYFLELEQYKNMPNSYSIFSEEEKNELYRFALNYQKWLEQNNNYDENDLAVKMINKAENNFEQYDFIVVDEVQDLSELQLYMISKLVKNKDNIIWAGDFNQTVTPTFFNFSRLSNIYYSDYKTKMVEYTLTKNFRTSNEINKLINYVSDYRKKLISAKEEYKEKSLRKGQKPIIISPNSENLISILKNISDKMYCAMIVCDESDKQKLINIYPECKSRIFTVYEIKGLEYKNIYCYNILSYHHNAWKKILDGMAKNDESKRYYFNLFYVAISRAREILGIYEDKIDTLDNCFFDNCTKIENASSENICTSEKSLNIDIEKEIERLEKSGNYKQANSLRLNKRIVAKDVQILIELLKKSNGYNCFIFDKQDYIKKCIGNNDIEIVDIIGNEVKIKCKEEICLNCIYYNFCLIKDKDLLNIDAFGMENLENACMETVFNVNNRIYLFENEENNTEKTYCYQAEMYNKFSCYAKAIQYYTNAIELNKNCVEAYYCRSELYEKIGEKEKSNKDKEIYIKLL